MKLALALVDARMNHMQSKEQELYKRYTQLIRLLKVMRSLFDSHVGDSTSESVKLWCKAVIEFRNEFENIVKECNELLSMKGF